jgi:putative Holliday junction resolvase
MPRGDGWQCVLAFDFGTRKIGLAVGQSATGTASPLEILRCRNGEPDWAAIEDVVRQWQPQILIVGFPRQADGVESELTGRVRRFAAQLASRTGVVVQFVDEHLSTAEARSRLENKRGRFKGGALDAMAACVILESWLADSEARQP